MKKRLPNIEAQRILRELNLCWHRLPWLLRLRIVFLILVTLPREPEPVKAHWV